MANKKIRKSTKSIEQHVAVAEETVETTTDDSTSTELATVNVTPSETETAETPAPIEETPAETPEVPAAAARELDALGFGVNTETGYLSKLLLDGTHTKKEIIDNFLAMFSDGSDGDNRRKKTTASVFFSDVKRSIGTYHASRGLEVKVNEDSGVLSVSEDSLSAAVKAIGEGILKDLRGITPKRHASKYAKVLSSHGLAVK